MHSRKLKINKQFCSLTRNIEKSCLSLNIKVPERVFLGATLEKDTIRREMKDNEMKEPLVFPYRIMLGKEIILHKSFRLYANLRTLYIIWRFF